MYRPVPPPLHAQPSKPDGGGISSAADLLQKENELLKSTLQAVTQEPASTAEAAAAQDKATDADEDVDDPAISAEDYWSPVVKAGGEFVERYGEVSNPPEHDGTQCIQWDNTLSTHSDHFKVGGPAGVRGSEGLGGGDGDPALGVAGVLSVLGASEWGVL